jgi:hypothetical protein
MSDTCRWCGQPIAHDGRANWVHTSRAYTCRDASGTLMSSTAAPLPGTRWTGLYRSGWTVG